MHPRGREVVSEKVRERERERQMKPFFVCFKKTSLHSGGFTSGPVSQMRVMLENGCNDIRCYEILP